MSPFIYIIYIQKKYIFIYIIYTELYMILHGMFESNTPKNEIGPKEIAQVPPNSLSICDLLF